MCSTQSLDVRFQQAVAARNAGSMADARRMLEDILREDADHRRALNLLGLVLLALNDPAGAEAVYIRATTIDPGVPPLWLNRARAEEQGGKPEAQLASLDKALAIDPYIVPAVAQKADLLDRLGRIGEAVLAYAALLKMVGDAQTLPPALAKVVARGRERVQQKALSDEERTSTTIDGARHGTTPEERRRAEAFLDIRFGRRKVFHPEPTGTYFPFLPNDEYFDRTLFPWFDRLEAATDMITAELQALLDDRASGFAPYVQFPEGVPLNQWAELQNSSKWDSYFLWRNGQPVAEGIARCPGTAALIETLPLLDIAGKGPTVMFSLLAPQTTIPPHTGTTNIRTTVHLPLIVPDGCWFRVGGETRVWERGVAWAFDDTIEHEARNGSDELRAILIIDAWNPYLTEVERRMVRAAGG